MGAPQYEQAGADVAGTGTANYVAKWTGGSTLGNSIIAQDAGSTGIAIGDAAGVSYVGLVQIKKAGGAGWLTLDHTGGSYAEVQSYNVPLYLNRQGNNTILNSTSGNVGIGTTSPGTTLHVLSTGGEPARFASTGTGAYISLLTSSTSVRGYFGTANNFIGGTAATDIALLAASATGNVIFGRGGAIETMRIDGSGNVVLNTASTGATIQAAGSQQGLKLPATPGNTDAQTLDCYQENPLATTAGNGWTPTLSLAATWGGTQPNVTYARYVRIGSMVFCEVKLTMATGTMTSTYGTTTIDSPFTTNANASHAAVPVAAPGASGVGFQTGTTVYLPTIGASSTFILTWSFFA